LEKNRALLLWTALQGISQLEQEKRSDEERRARF